MQDKQILVRDPQVINSVQLLVAMFLLSNIALLPPILQDIRKLASFSSI